MTFMQLIDAGKKLRMLDSQYQLARRKKEAGIKLSPQDKRVLNLQIRQVCQ